MTEISRHTPLPQLKQQYVDIVGQQPPQKTENETYIAYRNRLVNQLLQQPNTKLRYGERISKNKPTDKTGDHIGRPRTTGRDRVCSIVAKNTNTNRVQEQNYECKRQQQPQPEVKSISTEELQDFTEDGLRRIITAIIPSRLRNKQLLQQRYNAKRGVLNDLTRPQLLDLLELNNITEINSQDAIKILKFRGRV